MKDNKNKKKGLFEKMEEVPMLWLMFMNNNNRF